jgi:hypothetical protein
MLALTIPDWLIIVLAAARMPVYARDRCMQLHVMIGRKI